MEQMLHPSDSFGIISPRAQIMPTACAQSASFCRLTWVDGLSCRTATERRKHAQPSWARGGCSCPGGPRFMHRLSSVGVCRNPGSSVLPRSASIRAKSHRAAKRQTEATSDTLEPQRSDGQAAHKQQRTSQPQQPSLPRICKWPPLEAVPT